MKIHRRQTASVNLPRLSTVAAVHNIVLAAKGKTIDPRIAIWTAQQPAGNGIPVAFDLNDFRTPGLRVAFQHDHALPAGTTLSAMAVSGTTRLILFEGTIADSRATVVVNATVKPSALCQLPYSTLYWELALPGGEKIFLGVTVIEMFWVNKQHVPPSLDDKGTPVELLRNFASMVDVDSFFTGVHRLPVETIVRSVFTFVPPRYDIWHGAPHFTHSAGRDQITLHYYAYLTAHHQLPGALLNCYDAAALVQYGMFYNGYPCLYGYMQPFGYLFRSDLIGRGACNSPFYGSADTLPVVYQTYPARTAFANHAFAASSLPPDTHIADGCAGPHAGSETAAQYVDSATDPTHPQHPTVRRGNVKDIQYFHGVKSRDFLAPVTDVSTFAHSDHFKQVIGFPKDELADESNTGVAGNWPDILDHAVLKEQYEQVYQEIVPGDNEVLKMIFLKKGAAVVIVKIHVASGDQTMTRNRFLSLGMTTMDRFPYKKGPDYPGAFTAVSENKNQEYQRCFWMYHNVVVDILSNDRTLDIRDISDWYYAWAQRHLSEDVSRHLPMTGSNPWQATVDAAGELVVSITAAEDLFIDVVHTPDSPRLISRDDHRLVFDRLQADTNLCTLLVVDRKRMLMRKVRYAFR